MDIFVFILILLLQHICIQLNVISGAHVYSILMFIYTVRGQLQETPPHRPGSSPSYFIFICCTQGQAVFIDLYPSYLRDVSEHRVTYQDPIVCSHGQSPVLCFFTPISSITSPYSLLSFRQFFMFRQFSPSLSFSPSPSSFTFVSVFAFSFLTLGLITCICFSLSSSLLL